MFIKIVAEYIYVYWVSYMNTMFTMKKSFELNNTLRNHPYCRYATDFIFIQTNWETGSVDEIKINGSR